MIFSRQNFHQNLFFHNLCSLQNLIRCKTFDFKNWHVVKFSIRSLLSCEIMALNLKHFWKSWFKKWRFLQKMIQKLVFLENFDPKLPKNAQESQLLRFYSVKWPDKRLFESEFSNKIWISENSFFIEIWCVV